MRILHVFLKSCSPIACTKNAWLYALLYVVYYYVFLMVCSVWIFAVLGSQRNSHRPWKRQLLSLFWKRIPSQETHLDRSIIKCRPISKLAQLIQSKIIVFSYNSSHSSAKQYFYLWISTPSQLWVSSCQGFKWHSLQNKYGLIDLLITCSDKMTARMSHNFH